MKKNLLAAIGNTPLVQLTQVIKGIPFQLYAKLEALNPGGSMKDRPAKNIIQRGIDTGMIRSGTVVVESSSGNMGIGLAQVCSYLGLRFICVVDPKITLQNSLLLKVYGAEIDLVTEPDRQTGEYLQARIDRVQELLTEHPDSFWPNQYANLYNAHAHRQTMREIVEELDGKLDYFFCATSTCGTLRGCSEYLREQHMKTKIYAVDAVGSVIFGGEKAKRLLPGHGAAVRPELYAEHLADHSIHVTDLDCVVGCRRLVRHESILAGGSAGAVLMAIEKVKDEIPPSSTCAAIFADRGERYLDTIYSDAWVAAHFGEIPADRLELEEEQECLITTY